MSLLHEATFERLLPRYERAFGGPPPFSSAPLDEVVEHMRHRLRAAGAIGQPAAEIQSPNAGLPPDSGGRPVH